jgi:hypothetical protein
MIKIQESVPSVYYNSSRDFQFIGHLFDLVLNAVKTDADLLFNLPLSINSDDQLLDLMTYTFGLRLDKKRYNSKQLRAICSVAPQMLRAKGSKKAVQLLCTALMHADGLEDQFDVHMNDNNTVLTIYLSPLASCKDIILEILPYILPAGIVFNIVSIGQSKLTTTTEIGLEETVYTEFLKDPDSQKSRSEFSCPSISEAIAPGIFKKQDSASETDYKLALKSNIATNALLVRPSEMEEISS